MSLLRDVVDTLQAEGIPFALIGAAAMAVHGVSRATADIDLLTVNTRVLDEELWSVLEARGVGLRLLKGDVDDPLAGNVRLSLAGDRMVDVVVGRYAWQREIIEAAEELPIGEFSVKVVRPSGLVLLKLHAGGPKDAWDIRALLESHEDATAIKADVDRLITQLPSEGLSLWARLRDGR